MIDLQIYKFQLNVIELQVLKQFVWRINRQQAS